MGTQFLFATPSFVGGAASVMDIGATLFMFNNSLTPEQADAIAMRADWRAVGDALRDALRELEQEADVKAAKQPAR